MENFKAGTMAKMGFSFEEIQKINPCAILVSITGFGQFGPDSKRPAYDGIISHRAHLYSKIGEGNFQIGPILMSDTLMGMNAATAALAALHERATTGTGRWVDCCMLTSSVGASPLTMADYAMNGDSQGTVITSPDGTFQTKDNAWVNITAGPQPMFLRLRELVDDPIIKDEQYISEANRARDCALLCERLGAWIKDRTCDEVNELMDQYGITCTKVCTWDDVLNDRQLAYREDIIQLPVKNCGTVPYAKFPAKFYGMEYIEDTPVPEVGADNLPILSELLGMTPEEVEEYTK